MNQLQAVLLRLALIQGSRDRIVDKLSNKLPAIPRGNGVNLQCAMFLRDPSSSSLVDDVSNLASVSMQVRKDTAAGDAIFDKTIAIGAFDNASLAWSAWDANTSQHFTFELGASETGQAMPSGKTELPIYIAFQANPLVGDPIFLGSVTTVIFEEGIGSSGSPITGDPTYSTLEEANALYGRPISQAIPNGQNYVDVDISALALASGPTHCVAAVKLPSAGADLVAVAGYHVTDTDTVRVYLQAAVPSVGYAITLFVTE